MRSVEDYPHLFVSNDPEEVRRVEEYREPRSVVTGRVAAPIRAVAEITDEEWAGYSLAADKYYRWIEKLEHT